MKHQTTHKFMVTLDEPIFYVDERYYGDRPAKVKMYCVTDIEFTFFNNHAYVYAYGYKQHKGKETVYGNLEVIFHQKDARVTEATKSAVAYLEVADERFESLWAKLSDQKKELVVTV